MNKKCFVVIFNETLQRFRPSKTGPMTIELQRPDGNKVIEVRYAQ